MPADTQQQRIREMVDALAQRLQQRPEDEQGWVPLRSRMVLGQPEAAHQALAHARAAFREDAAARARIAAEAKSFGLTD